MSKKLAGIVVALALLGTAPAAAPAIAADAPTAAMAKTCSRGFKHARINGAEKCLRRGQFCARRHDQQYRRYGFRCVKRDARGNYHLT
jgi:hypothetical protein